MADKVDEVDRAAREKMIRKDISFPEDMAAWMKSAAKSHGLTESGLVKMLVAAELTRIYGPGWADGPSEQDHR